MLINHVMFAFFAYTLFLKVMWMNVLNEQSKVDEWDECVILYASLHVVWQAVDDALRCCLCWIVSIMMFVCFVYTDHESNISAQW